MQALHFAKMEGLGNDFVVIDATAEPVELTAPQVRAIAHRRLGVGCDQVLLAEPPTRDDADFRYRIFNADGGEVEHCGNGIRCLARFLQQRGLAGTGTLRIETAGRLITVTLRDDDVSVDMGPPELEPDAIPFRTEERAVAYPLLVDGAELEISAVSMGNPHAVLLVEDVDRAPVTELGPTIERHSDFPNRVNAGFLQVVDGGHARVRVYERGAGETLACGTGACAAVVAGRLRGLLDEHVEVALRGGTLVIDWAGGDAPVIMTGPARHVFDGVMPAPPATEDPAP
ncbi:diaminopimelate epimerase [Arhodomonas aquaeolei]|uniref:diaminopimelate epimerase n=1 Tax=Arhodomonas aquaeolei TaxID=2369 RepID=UPI00036B0DDA|nr:diaminopimelate epimerase [Arhodomonas aquaeolei]